MLITISFSFILEWPGSLDFNSLSCSILQHIVDITTRHMHIDAPIIHITTQLVVIHIVS